MKFYLFFVILFTATINTENSEILYDYYIGLEAAEQTDKTILLFFTAKTCKHNEAINSFLENDTNISKKVKEKYVPVILYVDDPTELKEHKLREFNGNKIKLITKGNEWAFLEQSMFNENVQPLIVLIDKNENILKDPLKGEISNEMLLNYINN